MMKRKAFTLIELLVVVLIIGILASVALPQYFKTVEKSRAAEAISVISTIAAAQDREYMRNGVSYANAVSDLDVAVNNLKYFSAPLVIGNLVAVQRNANTPTYGAYWIWVTLPVSPGAGTKVWNCSGTGCRTFLPG